MTQRKKLILGVAWIVFWAQACEQIQAPVATPVPASTSTPAILSSPTPLPTHTLAPSVTPLPVSSAPFQRVVSLPETLAEFPLPQVRALADGSVWIIASQSVFRWDGQEIRHVRAVAEGTRVDVDERGRLWSFERDADEITAWQNGRQTTYGAERGWTSARTSPVWAPKPLKVSTAKDGTLWLATDQDVRSFDGQRWKIYTRKDMRFPPLQQENEGDRIDYQITLAVDGTQVWVGECQYGGPGPIGGSGVRWFDGATWRGENAPVGSTCIHTLDSDFAGNLWVSADDVIWRYEPAHQKWSSYPLPKTILEESYNFAYPLDLIVNNSGDIWVYLEYCGGASCGVAYKLHRIHNGEWSFIFEKSITDLLFQNQQLIGDGNGLGWLFWGKTVYQLEGDTPMPVAELPVLGADISPSGEMWIVDNNALWVLKP